MAVRCLAYVERQNVVNESVRESFLRRARRPLQVSTVRGSWPKVSEEGLAGVGSQGSVANVCERVSRRGQRSDVAKVCGCGELPEAGSITS